MKRPTSEQYRVYLYQEPIARLIRHDDFTRLVLDERYINDSRRAVLGLRFEENLRARHAVNMRLPAWFSNLLPEGRLREWIGKARGVPIEREMELLAQVGHDLPGAVQVLPVDEPLQPELVERNGSELSPPGTGEPTPVALWRFSLAGVGLKFSMLAKGDRFTAPAVGEGGDWIVKLPDSKYPDVPRNEFAMMTLARAIGINVPDVRLVHREEIDSMPDRVWPPGELFAYAVRRFDRGKNRELIHIEDMAQVRGFYPDEKYSGTFETVGSLVFRGRDVAGLQEFARRLVFDVMIGNGDAHLKNWSLIYNDPRIASLSPAYDLVATTPCRPAEDGPEDLGLKFGGSRRFEKVQLSNFANLDARLRANAGLADLAAELVGRVAREWACAADILAENPTLREAIKSHIDKMSNQLRT